jgi:hypothetical protein
MKKIFFSTMLLMSVELFPNGSAMATTCRSHPPKKTGNAYLTDVYEDSDFVGIVEVVAASPLKKGMGVGIRTANVYVTAKESFKGKILMNHLIEYEGLGNNSNPFVLGKRYLVGLKLSQAGDKSVFDPCLPTFNLPAESATKEESFFRNHKTKNKN